MTHAPQCINPIKLERNKANDPWFDLFIDEQRVAQANQVMPYTLDIELTNKCLGGCLYCYSSSTPDGNLFLPTDMVMRLLDEAYDLGVRKVTWYGGDPHMHPDWFKLISYAGEKGMGNVVFVSGLLAKRDVEKLLQLEPIMDTLSIHISAINQAVFNQLHRHPESLSKKMATYQTLLERGFSHEKMTGCITVTHPTAQVIEETIDWYVDEMGAKTVLLSIFRMAGFGDHLRHLEPTLSDCRRAYLYRAKRCGAHWEHITVTDSQLYCRSTICIFFDGTVNPCVCIRDLGVGSLYEESLTDIVMKHCNELLFNLPIKGKCGDGTCENKDICFGCRASAYHILGDLQASDPKCWLNPEAKESYFGP